MLTQKINFAIFLSIFQLLGVQSSLRILSLIIKDPRSWIQRSTKPHSEFEHKTQWHCDIFSQRFFQEESRL